MNCCRNLQFPSSPCNLTGTVAIAITGSQFVNIRLPWTVPSDQPHCLDRQQLAVLRDLQGHLLQANVISTSVSVDFRSQVIKIFFTKLQSMFTALGVFPMFHLEFPICYCSPHVEFPLWIHLEFPLCYQHIQCSHLCLRRLLYWTCYINQWSCPVLSYSTYTLMLYDLYTNYISLMCICNFSIVTFYGKNVCWPLPGQKPA